MFASVRAAEAAPAGVETLLLSGQRWREAQAQVAMVAVDLPHLEDIESVLNSGFLLAGGLAFLIQNRIRAGGYELNPDHPVISFVFTSAQIIAVFLFSAPHHLLPWMAPAMIVAGYALLPGPGKGSKG